MRYEISWFLNLEDKRDCFSYHIMHTDGRDNKTAHKIIALPHTKGFIAYDVYHGLQSQKILIIVHTRFITWPYSWLDSDMFQND